MGCATKENNDFIEIDYVLPSDKVEKNDLIDTLKKCKHQDKPLICIGSWPEMEDENISQKFSILSNWKACLPNTEGALTPSQIIENIKKYNSEHEKPIEGIRIDLAEYEDPDADGYWIPYFINEYTEIYSNEDNTILVSNVLNLF